MIETGTKNPMADLSAYGFKNVQKAHWNLSQDELIDRSVELGLGVITDSGALAVDTGEFTGRAPKDKFFVKDEKTRDTVYWGEVIQRKGQGATQTFIVRKISNGVGVERVFPLFSPSIDSIEVNKHGKVRRSRIYYIRDLKGKKARIKERRMNTSDPSEKA